MPSRSTMKGSEFLGTARRLLAGAREELPRDSSSPPLPAPPEADLRTAASRAYYALFLTIRDTLDPGGTLFHGDGRVHGEVSRLLLECWEQNRQQMTRVGVAYKTLRSLYACRTEGDYLRPREMIWSVPAIQRCINGADAQISNVHSWDARLLYILRELYPRIPPRPARS